MLKENKSYLDIYILGFPRIPKRIITDIVFFAEHDRLKVTKVTPG